MFLDYNHIFLDEIAVPRTLRPLLGHIQNAVKKIGSSKSSTDDATNVLVVLDDISTIEWTGYTKNELSRFCRSLSAFCTKVRPVGSCSLCLPLLTYKISSSHVTRERYLSLFAIIFSPPKNQTISSDLCTNYARLTLKYDHWPVGEVVPSVARYVIILHSGTFSCPCFN